MASTPGIPVHENRPLTAAAHSLGLNLRPMMMEQWVGIGWKMGP